jgi:sugar diacid utilization regulator
VEAIPQACGDLAHALSADLNMGMSGAFIRTRFNLTKSAEILTVHPNTVVYRLRRIRELGGRDPHDVDDLIVLALGLRVHELHATSER